MKPASDVPLMMKGTPCSRGNYAPLKTSSKTCISVEVQGLGPWRGLGHPPNLACFIGQWFGCGVCSTHNTNPAKRVRAWARSGHSFVRANLQVRLHAARTKMGNFLRHQGSAGALNFWK